MYTTSLRKVGDSTVLSVPPAILDLLRLQAGEAVSLTVQGQTLIIQPHAKPRYTLDDLLDQCDEEASVSEEDQAWLNVTPSGRER